MKNIIKLKAMRSIAIIALVAIIGFAVSATFTACGNDKNGNGDGTRDAKTYTGTAEGVTYTLKIEDGGSRAVLTPKQGDKYTLTRNADTKKSTGTVTKVVGGVLTLAPKEGPDDEFTAAVSGDNITAMSGNITWDDGTANIAPVALTPSGGIDPGPGTDPDVDSSWKWTAVEGNIFGTATINAIAYGSAGNAGGRFVAGGGGGKIAYSDDNGASWTAVTGSKFVYNSSITGIAYGNNRFVAVGYVTLPNTGKIAYSDDGESWTAVSNSTFDASNSLYYDIAYGSNRFVAVGSGLSKMAYSADGESWTAVSNTTFTNSITAIAYGNGRFVAGGNSCQMAYSDDGASWTAVANSTFETYLSDRIDAIAFGNNRFIAGRSRTNENKVAYSTNGESWTAAGTNILGAYKFDGEYIDAYYLSAIAYCDNRFFAVGSKIAYSTDGASWTVVADSPFEGPFGATDIITAFAYGNNRFVAVSKDGQIAYSADGASWTRVSNSPFGTSDITAIAYGNNRFVAVGLGGKMAYADW